MGSFAALLSKNFKNLFRSLGSMFILVIGPLLLMGVLIAAFSDLGFQSIRIGYAGDNGTLGPLLGEINYLGDFVYFESLQECNEQLKNQRLHLCMNLSGGQRAAIDLYFDNTREIISYILISQLRQGVGRQEEQMLKSQTYSFIGQVRDVGLFIEEKRVIVGEIVGELEGYKRDIRETQDSVEQSRNDVEVYIVRLESLRQNIVTARTSGLDQYGGTSAETSVQITRTRNDLQSARAVLVANGQSTAQVDEAISALTELESSLRAMNDAVNEVHGEVDSVVGEIDAALESLRRARDSLDQTQRKLQEVDASIDQRVVQLRQLDQELAYKKSELRKVEGLDVEQLVNPYVLNFEPLHQGSRRIQELREELSGIEISEKRRQQLISIGSVQTLLPVVIALMICFVSVIIGNMITLDEIHSPAYTRNQLIPVSKVKMALATVVTILLLLLVQVGVVLGIGYVVFFLDLARNLWIILLVCGLLVIIYSLLGISLAYLVNTPTTSLLVSAFFLIVNLFLSGLAFPVERMSPIMLKLSLFVPFRDGLSILQQSIFYEIPFQGVLPQVGRLVALSVLAVVVLLVSYKVFVRRFQQGI